MAGGADVELVEAQRIHTNESATTEPPEDAVPAEDIPPNGGYGWVCTGCVFLMNAHSWGLNAVCRAKKAFCSTR
jgi:hypothetical protein